MKQKMKMLVGALALLVSTSGYCAQQSQKVDNSPYKTDDYRYSVAGFLGFFNAYPFGSTLTMHFKSVPNDKTLYGMDFGYTPSSTDSVQKFLAHIDTKLEFDLNLAYFHDAKKGAIFQFDPFFALRYYGFPWNRYLMTTIALGEGVSYSTQTPTVEDKPETYGSTRFLNYLMVEATFALPSYPQWQLIFRIHHRSGAYGLYYPYYNHHGVGSNVYGVGLRYLF